MLEREAIRLREERVVRWSGRDRDSATSRHPAANGEGNSIQSLIASSNGRTRDADLASYVIEQIVPSRRISAPAANAKPLGYSFKRVIDIVGSIAGLVFFGPLMILVSLLIWALDQDPIIFAQERIGFDGRKFRILKFRTMQVDADKALAGLLENDFMNSSEWLQRQKLVGDPRITPLGRLLRLSSIDELPQLFNVLKGDMSLIGPRPIVDDERARYGRYFHCYCAVRPGLTGLWQVSGRNSTTYERRVALDVTYSRRISLSLDLKILLLTIPAVLGANGCS